MTMHPHAGQLPAHDTLINIPALVAAYYTEFPSPGIASEQVAFGTSGHRGSSLNRTFNEEHIYAITQAVCDIRKACGITGPLFLGVDTHALSEPASRSALEVLAGNEVSVRIARNGGYTPTPAISHAILSWNRANPECLADGIVITPSHNPPGDGGFKYNPPHGGPAESAVTKRIEQRANELLARDNKDVHLVHLRAALASKLVREHDFIRAYVDDLDKVLDMDAIAASGIRLGVDPLGGASLAYWEPIAERYKLNLTVVNREQDPTFRFIPCDKDGKTRMDCSSPWAMSRLLDMKDDYDLAFGCDPDADRHGIVTSDGLMNPNHYLAVAAEHLLRTRDWPATTGLGKTLVTSSMLDRVAASLARRVVEVPVGFKWFVPYLTDGSCGLCCEESAGASFLRKDGLPWSTDKDGPLLCLLAAEIMAKRHATPSEIYRQMTTHFGEAVYERLDAPADARTRAVLLALTPAQANMTKAGGTTVTSVITQAPGNGQPIGGVKVSTADGWFAIRPSGTEDICKVYAESFKGPEHLRSLQKDAIGLLERLLQQAS